MAAVMAPEKLRGSTLTTKPGVIVVVARADAGALTISSDVASEGPVGPSLPQPLAAARAKRKERRKRVTLYQLSQAR
jgi:hypothetical protein